MSNKIIEKEMFEKVRQAEKNTKINQDPYKLGFHLMPPTGWLNDPNGLCQFKGVYHVFFQYSPFDAEGGDKFWGHYVSKDMISWEYKGPVMGPDTSYDKDGVYLYDNAYLDLDAYATNDSSIFYHCWNLGDIIN